jgi:hypothetical protein
MVNDLNAYELSDEQLDTVTGGHGHKHHGHGSHNFGSFQNAGNSSVQLNIAIAPTINISLFNSGTLTQSGATILQGNSSAQYASNS